MPPLAVPKTAIGEQILLLVPQVPTPLTPQPKILGSMPLLAALEMDIEVAVACISLLLFSLQVFNLKSVRSCLKFTLLRD